MKCFANLKVIRFIQLIFLSIIWVMINLSMANSEPMHGIAMHGSPQLPSNFESLPYVNPNAPKDGSIVYGVQGNFNSLNQFIVQGAASSARGLRDSVFGNNVYESLMLRNRDEAFTLYGLIAESIETPEDRAWVEFKVRKIAKFSDGIPITADDVIFSAELLRDKGRPNYRYMYDQVAEFRKVDDHTVRFVFNDTSNRELPLLLGMAPILPKHAIDVQNFDKSTLVPIVGSGPYLIDDVKPGASITLKRNPNYWGKDLPIKAGLDNYNQIRIDYYKDENSLFESFKKGNVHLLIEGDPSRWQTAYDFPAVDEGKVVKETFVTGTPKGMFGLAMNLRQDKFSDINVRRALIHLFDFEWINQNIFHGIYQRTSSFFEGSVLESSGRPATEAEIALLQPFMDEIDPKALDGTLVPPINDGSGRDRKVISQAIEFLKKGGYDIIDGKAIHKDTGEQLSFELMTKSSDEERLALSFSRSLELAGIELEIRAMDDTQYQKRRQTFDFDMMFNYWGASLSPGNEQNFRWSSSSADIEGSWNFSGVKSPAVDEMIKAMLEATDSEEFVSAVRAYDRALLSGAYVIPLYHLPEVRIARWSHLKHSGIQPLVGYRLDSWWAE